MDQDRELKLLRDIEALVVERERLRAGLENARRDLNGLCPRSDTGSKRKNIIMAAVARIEAALQPVQTPTSSLVRAKDSVSDLKNCHDADRAAKYWSDLRRKPVAQ